MIIKARSVEVNIYTFEKLSIEITEPDFEALIDEMSITDFIVLERYMRLRQLESINNK